MNATTWKSIKIYSETQIHNTEKHLQTLQITRLLLAAAADNET